MNHITQSFKIVLLAVFLSFGISYAFAWVAPTVAPTGGNSVAPLNTSSNDQTKNGNIFLNALGITNTAPNALNVAGGGVFGGSVGIGTAVPNQKLEVKEGKIRINKGITLYNTSGPFTGCTAGGGPTRPDPVAGSHADVCTCYTGNKTSTQLGGTRCTYNSFMSGGNNSYSCVYSCDISGTAYGVQKTVDLGIDANGNFEVTPSPTPTGYTNSNFGGMYVGTCQNAGDENPYTGSCSCPAGFSAHYFTMRDMTLCYR